MKKKIIAAIGVVTMIGSLCTGCLVKNEDAAKAAQESEENVLNIYTALEDEQISDYLAEFKEKNPDVEINITRDSTGVITSKLLAEKDNPVADVVWGLSVTSLLELKEENLLEGYAPKGVDRILPEFKDSSEQTLWVGMDAWETAFIVNKEVLKSHGVDTVPKSYEDLLDASYEGLIAMSNPVSSGTGLLTVNGILQLMGEEEGWNYLDQLDKNVAVYLHSGSKPAKDTAAGEYGIGISFGYRCIKSVEEVGNDIAEVVFPEEGSGWDIEANALIQKDKEKDVAKKFLDWAISDNVMEKYAKNYPIIATGTGDSIPEGYTVNPIDQLITGIDFEELAINREDVLSKWTDRYDGKSAQK